MIRGYIGVFKLAEEYVTFNCFQNLNIFIDNEEFYTIHKIFYLLDVPY